MILIRALNCSQGQRYLELAEKRQANESFVYGWDKGTGKVVIPLLTTMAVCDDSI